MKADDLRSAYDQFFIVAEGAGPLEAQDAGGWTVAHVVAHIAANDELLAAFIGAVSNGENPDYDNDPVWRTTSVQNYLDQIDGWPGEDGWTALIEHGRARSEAVLTAVAALDESVAANLFDVRLLDGGVERVNGPMPLAALIHAHTTIHLPSHADQIRALQSAGSPS